MGIYRVHITNQAKKEIKKIPKHIFRKLMLWIMQVEKEGLEKTRKTPGYHDEPLRGKRLGQRSIRLNIAYRAIYEIKNDSQIEFVSVEEVHKHDY